MNPRSLMGITLFLAATLNSAQAQQASDQLTMAPGQLATSPSEASLVAPGAMGTSSSTPTNKYSIAAVNPRDARQTLWYASILAAVGATTFDSASSWQRHESNSLLASPNGTFGSRAVGIKIGAATATLLPQFIWRKHKEMRTGFILGNMAQSAIFTAAAIHNVEMKK